MRASHRGALRSGAQKAYSLTYTGAKNEDTIVRNGKAWRRLTLTGSGTLTVAGTVVADICAVGGGSKGAGSYGGAGGYVVNASGRTLTTCTVTIGAAGGDTKIGTVTAAGVPANRNGQSGGGSRATYTAGTGAGTSTSPFGDTVNFQRHAAGGGGGGAVEYFNEQDFYGYLGGAGGSNGASGSSGGQWGLNRSSIGGAGGLGGAGKGGNGSIFPGTGGNATYYGSGGGGCGLHIWEDGTTSSGAVGLGYQGVCYLLIDTEAYIQI